MDAYEQTAQQPRDSGPLREISSPSLRIEPEND